jgi:putative acetyltransferase
MIHIRGERAGEQQAVRSIHLATFPNPDEAELVQRLKRDGDALVSLVADAAGSLVGHLMFSPVSLDPPAPELFGAALAPLAVLPAWQGRGIGSRLSLAGLEACREAGLDYVVVLGEPLFYRRFGFRRAASLGLADTWEGEDAFQAMELRNGALSGIQARVNYAPAFAALVQAAS